MCNNKATATISTGGGRVLEQVQVQVQVPPPDHVIQTTGTDVADTGIVTISGTGTDVTQTQTPSPGQQQLLLEAARHLQDQVNQLLTHMLNTTRELITETNEYGEDDDEDEDDEDETEEKIINDAMDSPVKKYKAS